MKKIIILLLCCGLLVSMVGCDGNTAPPPTESPPKTVSETIITEVPTEKPPPVAAVEPTGEEKAPPSTESTDQATELTVTATESTTADSIEETKTTVPSTAEEKTTHPIKETAPNTAPQLTEREAATIELPKVTEPPIEAEFSKVTEPEPAETPAPFDIDYWITFAKEYAVSIGLTLDSAAVDCWDNPIRASAHCIYLERDIQSRLNRYAKDEDITDVWIWTEATDDDCYDIYIGYA